MRRESSKRRSGESEEERIFVDYETHSETVFISHRDKESNENYPYLT